MLECSPKGRTKREYSDWKHTQAPLPTLGRMLTERTHVGGVVQCALASAGWVEVLQFPRREQQKQLRSHNNAAAAATTLNSMFRLSWQRSAQSSESSTAVCCYSVHVTFPTLCHPGPAGQASESRDHSPMDVIVAIEVQLRGQAASSPEVGLSLGSCGGHARHSRPS
jgi:hypothetical protein